MTYFLILILETERLWFAVSPSFCRYIYVMCLIRISVRFTEVVSNYIFYFDLSHSIRTCAFLFPCEFTSSCYIDFSKSVTGLFIGSIGHSVKFCRWEIGPMKGLYRTTEDVYTHLCLYLESNPELQQLSSPRPHRPQDELV